MQYADDTIIFSNPDCKYIASLKFLLYAFESLSGLKINFHKSSVYTLGCSVDMNRKCAEMLNCMADSFPLKYLGAYIRPKRLMKSDWQYVIDKVDRRLARWKGNCLSKAGRLVLVNSVLAAIPLYWLSFYSCPGWVVQKIDAVRRNFFWTGTKDTRKVCCLVSWDQVCKSKDQGGLGVINLKNMNSALLCKWLWTMLSDKKVLWKEWILNTCYGGSFDWNADVSHCSVFWHGVMANVN